MSDSEASVSLPSKSKIEQTVISVVKRIFKSGNHADLTVKRIRKAAEEELDLEEDFFKSNDEWNKRSKALITEEVGRLENEEAQPQSSPAQPKKPAKKNSAQSNGKAAPPPKPKKAAETAKRGTKRATPEAKPKARKKRKVSVSEESTLSEPPSDESQDEDSEPEPPKPIPKRSKAPAKKTEKKTEKKTAAKPRAAPKASPKTPPKAPSKASKGASRKVIDSDDEDDEDEVPPVAKAEVAQAEDNEEGGGEDAPTAKNEVPPQDTVMVDANASESEMSVLIDEEPPPKKKRQKKASSDKPAKAKPTKSSSSKKPAKPAADLSPDEEEIKRLQGWLLKCGIRKLWHRELAPYSSSKDKVRHLREMLKDAGMDGRYSVEKAKQIKERRELASELEAVEEFGKKWGSREEGEGKRKRTMADMGIDEALLGSDNGEETD